MILLAKFLECGCIFNDTLINSIAAGMIDFYIYVTIIKDGH